MVSVVGRIRPWMLAGVTLGLTFALGCGSPFRPIVTDIPPVQPAAQPEKFAVVINCGAGANPAATNVGTACNNAGAIGLGSIVDFAGDSIATRVNLGNGPRWMGLDYKGGDAYTANADGTINEFTVSTKVETNQDYTSTLLPGASPSTLLWQNGYNLYVTEPGRNAVAAMFGTPEAVRLEIPIPGAPVNQNVVNLVGTISSQRIYAIAQGPTACAAGSLGSITAIETLTNTISTVIPAGNCPIYGVMSADNRRAFILNQGSGTVTVIDSEQNQLDRTIPVGNGPVWADIFNTGSILAVVNSGSNTLSLIDISLDAYGNDSPDFGRILATVPVGANPVSVAALQDGTQVFVANQGDGTVSAVSLTSFTVTKTIPVAGHPISIAATTGTPLGKVYVVSPDSNLLTILRTDNDTISTSLQMTGTGVQVRVSLP